MKILKRFEKWLESHNKKMISQAQKKYKNNHLPLVDIIETKSGVEIKFCDEKSKQRFLKKIAKN